AVRLRQTEASAKVGEQYDKGQAKLVSRSAGQQVSRSAGQQVSRSAGQQVSRSAGQQFGSNPCANVSRFEALQVGVSRSAIQGCPAARNPQLWNRPDLRHV
ncbi:MAG TPA: hypothetical protein VFX23_09405, partial [Limnobacter sp.]|uniref:hypothetical protein n=1 Tax=Limnobacter sp. TaxID=2003368 RepID=UPI002E378A43